MYYTIYKITNTINGKFYVGKHETLDLNDDYFSSGKALLNAAKKYGRKHFIREIIHIFDARWKMNLAEKILVVVDFETSYNMGPGGEGGPMFLGKNHSDETKLKISIKARGRTYKKTQEQLKSERQARLAKNDGNWHSLGAAKRAAVKRWSNPEEKLKQSVRMRLVYGTDQ